MLIKITKRINKQQFIKERSGGEKFEKKLINKNKIFL